MQSDGSRQRLLRRAPLVGSRPSWSPDGRRIVVSAGDDPRTTCPSTPWTLGRVVSSEAIMLLIDGDLAEGGWFSGGLLAPNGRAVVFQAYRPTPPDCKGTAVRGLRAVPKAARGRHRVHTSRVQRLQRRGVGPPTAVCSSSSARTDASSSASSATAATKAVDFHGNSPAERRPCSRAADSGQQRRAAPRRRPLAPPRDVGRARPPGTGTATRAAGRRRSAARRARADAAPRCRAGRSSASRAGSAASIARPTSSSSRQNAAASSGSSSVGSATCRPRQITIEKPRWMSARRRYASVTSPRKNRRRAASHRVARRVHIGQPVAVAASRRTTRATPSPSSLAP